MTYLAESTASERTSVFTTDATPMLVYAVPIKRGLAVLLTVQITALTADKTKGSAFVLRATYRNDNGVVTQVGETAIDFEAEDDSSWGGPSATVNGTNVDITVVGKVATSITWGADLSITSTT